MKNINEQIEKLQTELDELKAIANKPKEMIERVDKGERYRWVNAEFELVGIKDERDSIDDSLYSNGNYYTDEALAERVAKYYRDNNMFIRKGIEFADGYEFEYGEHNWCILINRGKYIVTVDSYVAIPGAIYMTKQNAEKFKAWLDEFMPLE